MNHPDDSTFERFVIGALEDDAEFVAHVAACDACSAKLQSEARVELAMFEVRRDAVRVAEARPPVQPARLRATHWVGPAITFAAAAGILVWFGHDRARHYEVGAEIARGVSCSGDDPRELECIARAHQSGAHLESPTGLRASLGREPGLSTLVEPMASEDNRPEFEGFLAKTSADCRACAERALVHQEGPILTGEIDMHVDIQADGKVRQSGFAIATRDGPMPEPDAPTPREQTDLALGRCLVSASEKSTFANTGQSASVRVRCNYVWRE